VPHLKANIYKCKRFVETGAEQLLLDVQSMKAILADMPVQMCGQKPEAVKR
jgi:hypothetical protein